MPADRSSSARPQHAEAHPHLRERVGEMRPVPLRVDAGGRGDHQNCEVRGLLQERQTGANTGERASRVDLMREIEPSHRGVARAGQADGARVVHEHVDPAEALDRLAYRRLDLRIVADIDGTGQPRPPADSISCTAVWIVPESFGCGATVLAAIATLAPSRAARSAIASPMPRLAPVTKRVLPPTIAHAVASLAHGVKTTPVDAMMRRGRASPRRRGAAAGARGRGCSHRRGRPNTGAMRDQMSRVADRWPGTSPSPPGRPARHPLAHDRR